MWNKNNRWNYTAWYPTKDRTVKTTWNSLNDDSKVSLVVPPWRNLCLAYFMISQRNKQIYSCRAEHNRHNETDRNNSAQSSLNSIPVRVTFIFFKSRLNSGSCAIELTGQCCYNRFRQGTIYIQERSTQIYRNFVLTLWGM